MSDFLKTNWFEKIKTDPIANMWSWTDDDGDEHQMADYIFQNIYVPANIPKVKQTNTCKKKKKKRKTGYRKKNKK